LMSMVRLISSCKTSPSNEADFRLMALDRQRLERSLPLPPRWQESRP
jgi:hypothetical protein